MLHASKKDMRTEEFFFSIISQLIKYVFTVSEINFSVERGRSSSYQVHSHHFNSLCLILCGNNNAILFTIHIEEGDSSSSASPCFRRRVVRC